MSSRFDYVKYDEVAAGKQNTFKDLFVDLEAITCALLVEGRAKSLVLTKLEEAYMWVGKAIRDEQVTLRKAELQEERTNS